MTEITRGRQYEGDAIPDSGDAFAGLVLDEAGPEPFGLILRRPGEPHTVYRAPHFAEPQSEWTTDATDDPRWGEGSEQHWALSLPHRCGEWVIGEGEHAKVLADAERLRDELDQAIDALRAEIPLPEGPRWHFTITPVTEPGDVEPPAPWPPEGTVGVQVYVGDPPRLIGGGNV